MIEQKEHFHGSDLEKIEEYYNINKDEIISFSANVNPLGISPLLRKTLSEKLDVITSYPDRDYTALRKSIAAYCDCDYKNILVGNGATELISLFIQITNPKNTLLLGPTYSEYERDLRIQGSQIQHYLLKEEDDFKLNIEDFTEAISSDTDFVIICNPNNPTSSVLTTAELSVILKRCQQTDTYVMVDETYAEFAPDVKKISGVSLCESFDNLIVLRGTSKFFASPGLRLGYAITANEYILREINTNKNPWMINSLAAVAGETMFSDQEYINATRELTNKERSRMMKLFSDSDKYKTYPSYGNFMLVKILDKNISSAMLFEKCIRQKLMIRDCSTFESLGDRYIRFCFMKKEDNQLLADCLLSD